MIDFSTIDVTKEETLLIVDISKRAVKEKALYGDLMSLQMDLEATHHHHKLRLTDLLKSDRFNFLHDVCGIQKHINRKTGKLGNHFLPRFSTK